MKKIAEEIRTGQFQRAYLLCGEEAYLRLRAKERLGNAIVPPDDSMNRSVFTGSGQDVQGIIGICDTLPFFAERRLVILENTGLFRNPPKELVSYLGSLPDYLTILFSEAEADKRSALYKAVEAAGRVVQCDRMNEAQLGRWAAGILGAAGRRIRQSDMEYLLSRTGNDMFTISGELEKLIALTQGKESVERADIDAIVHNSLENHMFDMVQYVAEGKVTEALALYGDLCTLKVKPQTILSVLTNRFRQLYLAGRYSAEGEAPSGIAQRLGIPAFAARRLVRLLSTWPEETLRSVVELCVSTEEEIKSGVTGERVSVETLLVRLATRTLPAS